MSHKHEILNIRDRYMIGDWVAKYGKPCKWAADDYNRSQLGMRLIEPIVISEDVLSNNGWYVSHIPDETYIRLYNDDIDEPFMLNKSYDNKGFWIVVGTGGYIAKIYSIHELQHALRLCGLHELADNFKVEGGEE